MHATDLEEELALLEEQDRRRARESFLAFYMRMTGYKPPRHFRVIAKLLQSIEEDKVDRAMIFAPPRHIKTLGASQLFPAWVMGRRPTTPVMSVVHTQRFAQKLGRKVRNLLRDPAWPFDDVQLAQDSQANDRWATVQGGEYNAFGMQGGSHHGNPAELLVMDDIVKGRKIALSAVQREEIWETYKVDLLSRLQGRRKQLLVFTRWNIDDPAGRILPENFDGRTGWYRDRITGEKWFVLSMPAVAEHDNDPVGRAPGEWLWPEAFGEKQIGAMRKRGGWMWSALYQQRPSPEEGLMFLAEHIQRYDPAALDHTGLKFYITSDYAVSEEAGAADPDYTVHLVWGVDADWNIYLMDGWRGRTTSDRWVREFIRLVRLWKPLRAGEEGGQIIKSIGPFLEQMLHAERVYVDRVQINSSSATGGKEQRAQALLGMASMGKFFVPMEGKCPPHLLPLVEVFVKELLQFPGGKHDDTVDAATLFGRMLSMILEGKNPKKPGSPHGDTLEDLWSRREEELRRRERDL